MEYKYIILGGTGHVGTALVKRLIAEDESVMIIGHSPDKVGEWTSKGVGYEISERDDSHRLHELFALGERLFILNPPAPPSTDTVKEESKSVNAVLTALQDTRLDKIVAASTYGAQAGDHIGDLGVLFQLEQGLAEYPGKVAIIRSAYYMSNWMTVLDPIKKDGVLTTLYPDGFKLPMVAPEDVGLFAAELMGNDVSGLHFIEGPHRYSPNDVGAAFSEALQKPVRVVSTPEGQWVESLRAVGFSEAAAEYMCNMTKVTLEDDYEILEPRNGDTSLHEYIKAAVEAKP